MYLNDTEEIIAIIVCIAIVVGFIVKTIQDIKNTVTEEKAKFNQQKEDEEKVRELIDFIDQRTALIKNIHNLQKKKENPNAEKTSGE